MTEIDPIFRDLHHNRDLFETLANSVPALVWMSGLDKKCFYFNRSWLAFTGRTLEQEMGDGWADGVHPEDLEACLNIYEEAFDKRQPFEMNYRLRRYDGEYRWIIDRGEVRYELNGDFAGYTGACIDVHDKILAEQKLKQSEERFNLAVRGMNDGLWDWDMRTDAVYYSPRCKEILGFEDHEFPNDRQAMLDRIHPDDRKYTIGGADAYLRGKIPEYKSVYRMMCKDGTYRWIMSRGIAVRDENGRALRFTGGHTDMTDQKELEAELWNACARAEAANMAKTDFLANMSHEIRTPMNVIVGLSGILSRTDLTLKQKEFISTLQASADSLLGIINDILDIARIEDNKINIDAIPFNFHELVDGVVNMMSIKAEEKNLTLSTGYIGIETSHIGDPVRLRQVIVNLVNNAIKFTHHGSVNVAVTAESQGDPETHHISIKISDTGIGIPPEKTELIFEKFTQVDSSITRKYGGSGLGLSIVRALVSRMNGQIDVSSALNQGSTFTVTLALPVGNVLETAAEKIQPQKESGEQQKKGHILLVEDYKPNVLIVSTLLNEFGYDYDVATNGAEALEKFEIGLFSAIIMDVQMQGMDGYETTRRIRKIERERKAARVPIIAMTAHALHGDREKCLSVGMDDYIAKPFHPPELKSKLDDLLQ